MDRTAIEKITELAEPNIIKNGGHTYSDKILSVIKKPIVDTVKLRTLSSLIKLIKTEIEIFTKPIIVNVESPVHIEVLCGIQCEDRRRENPYSVSADTVDITFNRFISYESMMIALKSKFIETPELLNLVQLLGTITEENNMQIADDGFTQSVTIRKGIALKENKAVNPRIKLKPYRTFSEVEQPQSEFLLRLDGNGGVALYEADGGAWMLEARKNIAEYLRNELKEENCIFIIE